MARKQKQVTVETTEAVVEQATETQTEQTNEVAQPEAETLVTEEGGAAVDTQAELVAALAQQGPFIGTARVEGEKAAVKLEVQPTKADMARAIFERMKGAERKDVIAAFMSEAGLTKAGSSTYYQNLKTKAKTAA